MDNTSTPKALGGAILPAGAQPLEGHDPVAIDGHRLAGRLTSGDASVVYLARDGGGDLVAIKTTHSTGDAQAQMRARLRTEASCVRRLPSFCTATLTVDGTDRTPPFIVTEYIEGPSLQQVIDESGQLEPDKVRRLAVTVARALTAIHDSGLVHCDIRPANILVTPGGPRVIDFGDAQDIGEGRPERITGAPAAPASDVFGWGCLVGYAATGYNPFGEGGGVDALRRAVAQPPELNIIDESVRGLVEAALSPDPQARPTARDLVDHLSATARPSIAPPDDGTEVIPAIRPDTRGRRRSTHRDARRSAHRRRSRLRRCLRPR